MNLAQEAVNFLQDKKLVLGTAESCTAGQVLALLGKIEGCGECLDSGYVVYSEDAKQRILNVKQKTIDQYTLTSEEVALEMVRGVLRTRRITVGLATTGITGDEPMDGIPPGTVCFAWGFKYRGKRHYFSETKKFAGERAKVQIKAAKYALSRIKPLYENL